MCNFFPNFFSTNFTIFSTNTAHNLTTPRPRDVEQGGAEKTSITSEREHPGEFGENWVEREPLCYKVKFALIVEKLEKFCDVEI